MSEIERLQKAYHEGVIAFIETSKRLDAVSAAEMQQAGIRFLLLALREPSEELLDLICCSMDRDGWRAHALQAWEVSIDHILNQDEGLGHHGVKARDRK